MKNAVLPFVKVLLFTAKADLANGWKKIFKLFSKKDLQFLKSRDIIVEHSKIAYIAG